MGPENLLDPLGSATAPIGDRATGIRNSNTEQARRVEQIESMTGSRLQVTAVVVMSVSGAAMTEAVNNTLSRGEDTFEIQRTQPGNGPGSSTGITSATSSRGMVSVRPDEAIDDLLHGLVMMEVFDEVRNTDVFADWMARSQDVNPLNTTTNIDGSIFFASIEQNSPVSVLEEALRTEREWLPHPNLRGSTRATRNSFTPLLEQNAPSGFPLTAEATPTLWERIAWLTSRTVRTDY